MRPGGLEPPAS